MKNTKQQENHAISNAAAWMASIVDMVRELHNAENADDGENDSTDSITRAIQESPLSVSVRSGWYSLGQTSNETPPEEFCILLSTGGPALRIIGDLDNGQPENPVLQWQDWGTPWTDYPLGWRDGVRFEPELLKTEQYALVTFCQQFYFGE